MIEKFLKRKAEEELGRILTNAFSDKSRFAKRVKYNNSNSSVTSKSKKSSKSKKLARSYTVISGGKFKRGSRKIRVWPKRKPSKNPQLSLGKMQSQGVLTTYELGISTTSGVSDSVYLGHTSFVRQRFLDAVCRVLVKKLFVKLGYSIGSFADFHSMPNGDIVQLTYRLDQNTSSSPFVINYTSSGPTLGSFEDIVLQLLASVQAISNPDAELLYIQYIPSGSTVTRNIINLVNSTVSIYAKSALKIQNATRSVAGTEADEVDNVPMYGKQYFGKGTGTLSGRNTMSSGTKQFYGHVDHGLIQKTGTLANSFAEMPPASYFRNVSSVGNARLEPGQIKTSVLTLRSTISLNWLMKKCWQPATNAIDSCDFGNFRFFGFEHMLKSDASTPNIKIMGELNYRIGVDIKTKLNNQTDEVVTNNTYVY